MWVETRSLPLSVLTLRAFRVSLQNPLDLFVQRLVHVPPLLVRSERATTEFGGARLYVSNRSDNSIGIFSVDAAGRPQKVGWQRMGAADVREFSFDPTGQFMVTANQSSSQVTVFRVDPAAGTLTQVGTPTTVASQATAVTFASR